MADPTTPDTPLSPEIVNLTDKLAKDPKSRLFVALAEEYLKSGMLDEALMVLTDGLKIHPNFQVAKTTLGKVHFEKGDIEQARMIFEEVIAVHPDNLLAHRRLARIYKDRGELERAKTSCQAVLTANPKDPEMKALMGEIEKAPPGGGGPAAGAAEEEERTERFLETTSVAEPESAKASSPKETGADSNRPQGAAKEPSRGSDEAEVPTGVVEAPPEPPVSPGPPAKETAGRAESVAHPVTTPAEQAAAIPTPDAASGESKEAGGEIATETLADLYIKQGFYDKGMEIYQKILDREPDNESVRRKADQTRSLMEILARNEKPGPESEPQAKAPEPSAPPADPGGPAKAGKGSESSGDSDKVRRLEAWLESIRKGQDR